MKKLSALLLFALIAFNNPKISPARIMSANDFLAQLNCSGPGCVSTSLVFPTPDAVSSAYPSPLTPDEQAGIYAPGNPVLRGYDNSYSIVVGGNYTVPSGGGREVEGRVAIGGDLIINNDDYGISQSGGGTFVVGAGGTTFPVAVQGSVSGSGSLGVGFNKGGSYIVRSGGPNTLPSSGGGSSGQSKSQNQTTSGVNITDIISGMKTVSANMCAATPTGAGGGANFIGTNAALEVFTVSNSTFGSSNLNFTQIAPGATVIVNITGTGDLTVGWTPHIGRAGETVTTDADAQIYNVIFNFCEASKVTFNKAFIGTVMIPSGDARITKSFDGRLYVSGNLVHSGEASEIHNYPFTGDLTPYVTTPLPVTLTSFQAKKAGNDVELNWSTQSEINFSHFEINHSLDAKEWQDKGDVMAESTSSASKSYTFKHNTVDDGNHFYRLKMIDMDGSFQYSRIQSVKVEANLDLVIQPNPVSTTFRITGISTTDNEPVQVNIYTKDGRVIDRFKRTTGGNLDFQIPSNWPKGLLFIRVKVAQNAEKAFKLIVQ